MNACLYDILTLKKVFKGLFYLWPAQTFPIQKIRGTEKAIKNRPRNSFTSKTKINNVKITTDKLIKQNNTYQNLQKKQEQYNLDQKIMSNTQK